MCHWTYDKLDQKEGAVQIKINSYKTEYIFDVSIQIQGEM